MYGLRERQTEVRQNDVRRASSLFASLMLRTLGIIVDRTQLLGGGVKFRNLVT